MMPPEPGNSLPSSRARRAAELARDDARRFFADPEAPWDPGTARARPRRLAIGDPQAPLATFLEILDRNDLLGADGRLHPEVFLASLGDHFDWGAAGQRTQGAASAVELLSWLGSHPADQVLLLAGNHDLARVGELAGFDDARFAEAHDEATVLRRTPMSDPGRAGRRERFLARHPGLPSVGVAARDWAQFEARQRGLVRSLMRAGRFRAAWAAAPDLLLVHGAVTPDDLAPLGVSGNRLREANTVADAIQRVFTVAVAALEDGAPLDLEPLYVIGSAARGESRGIFVQRPADPDLGERALFAGPPRRRFDPRALAPGLAQLCGHIRDQKCRELMPAWSDPGPAQDGPLRHLWTNGRAVRYARGLPDAAARAGQAAGEAALLHFADGGMNHVAPGLYELFDLDRRCGVSAGSRVR